MANGNNNNNGGGAQSQMDSFIQMNDLMELMKEKYGSDWEGMVSGSLHSPSQPMVLSNELKKSLFDFSGKKNQYTTTAAFPLQVFIDEWSKLNPGYESKDTQFYSGTGTGSTEEDALQNARMVAQLSAMYNPESYMQESPVATKGMQYDTPMSRGLEFLLSDVDKEGGKKMPGIAYGGLALIAFLLANSLSKGHDTGKRK